MKPITLGMLRSHDPCKPRWKFLLKTLNEIADEDDDDSMVNMDREITLEQILDICGVENAYWSLRCWPYRKYAPLLADVAESVLHIWENYSDNPCVRNLINGIRKYARDEINENELEKLRATVSDAAADADAVWAADWVAVVSAVASASADAAWAADADAVVSAFAAAAVDVDWTRNADAAWKKNEQLMRAFIERNKSK